MSKRVALLCVAVLLGACGDALQEDLPIANNQQKLVTGQNDLQYWVYKEYSMYTIFTDGNVLDGFTGGVGTLSLTSSPLNFRFYFYGKKVNTAYVSVHGLLTFDAAPPSPHSNNESVHTTNVGAAIAPWWDNVSVSSSNLTYKVCDTCYPRTITFQWHLLRTFSGGMFVGPSRDMQVTLYEHDEGSSDSNAIRMNYVPISPAPTTSNDSATVGLIAGTGSSASTETDCRIPMTATDMGVTSDGTNCDEQPHWGPGGSSSIVYKPAPQRYVRDTFTSTYTEITGTDVTPADRDDGSATITLPFDFTYYGNVYQSAKVSVNGMVSFSGGSQPYENQIVDYSDNTFNTIMPWWDDLILPGPMDPYPGSIQVDTRTITTGGPINELIIQWKDFQRYNGDGTRHNMQVHLFSTNAAGTMRQYIEVAYGPVSGTSTTDDATIGLKDEYYRSGGNYKLSPDCNPNCGAANWPAGNVYRYRRPTFTDLYDNYFTQTGQHTLHCFSCH